MIARLGPRMRYVKTYRLHRSVHSSTLSNNLKRDEMTCSDSIANSRGTGAQSVCTRVAGKETTSRLEGSYGTTRLVSPLISLVLMLSWHMNSKLSWSGVNRRLKPPFQGAV